MATPAPLDKKDRAVTDGLFEDYYQRRRQVYRVNFIRGIFFGLGSVLGGTVLIAVAVWVLSLFVDFPGIGHTVQQISHTLQQNK